MLLAQLLKEAAAVAKPPAVASPPKIKTPAPTLPTAAQIKPPKVSAGKAPQIPAMKAPAMSMPQLTAGLNIELPSANEILAESLGVSTKSATMQKEAMTPLLFPLFGLMGASPLIGRSLARQGIGKRMITLAERGGGVKGLLARLMVGNDPRAKGILGTAKNKMWGDVSGLDDTAFVRKGLAGRIFNVDQAERLGEEIAVGNSATVEALRRGIASRTANQAVRQGVNPNVAHQMALERAGLKSEAERMQKAMQTQQQAAGTAPGGIPWKWLLGGAGGAMALNGGLGNILGMGGQQQQQRPMPMMTMPMMYS